MYDWNGNGKHDSFDDAMFHALLDDDLRRHPPKGKSSYKSTSASDGSEFGCGLLLTMTFMLPIIILFAIMGLL